MSEPPVEADDREIRVGDRVAIEHGYEMDPTWLSQVPGHERVAGVVARFDPASAGTAAVVALDEALHAQSEVFTFLVLHLRHGGARWRDGATVHVTGFATCPGPDRGSSEPPPRWLESHAQVQRLVPCDHPEAR